VLDAIEPEQCVQELFVRAREEVVASNRVRPDGVGVEAPEPFDLRVSLHDGAAEPVGIGRGPVLPRRDRRFPVELGGAVRMTTSSRSENRSACPRAAEPPTMTATTEESPAYAGAIRSANSRPRSEAGVTITSKRDLVGFVNSVEQICRAISLAARQIIAVF
jgi:hypothetical protein